MSVKHTTYYGSRISENLAETPEGFLICRNVPIARVGKQYYLGSEIGLDDSSVYAVARDEAEVFSEAAIASFEGKPFTDEHPPDGVTPENAGYLIKGAVQNVRRGQGENSGFLMADLIVYDANTIREIREEGKREISCGYECEYVKDGSGGYRQTGIVGNHVALVKKGRAGEKVAIKDEKPEQGGRKPMPEKRTKKGFWANIIGLVRDNAPEDMETAMDEMKKSLTADEGELTEPAAAPAAPEAERPENPVEDEAPGAPEGNPLEARLVRLEQMLAQLLQAAAPKQEPDALDALEAELTGTNPAADEENSEVIEAEKKEGEAAADSLALLKTMKPVIAGIKDPQKRKAASDTLARLLRSQMGLNTRDNPGAYGQLLSVKQKDSQAKHTNDEDLYELGRIWAGRSNPHYMKKKEGK